MGRKKALMLVSEAGMVVRLCSRALLAVVTRDCVCLTNGHKIDLCRFTFLRAALWGTGMHISLFSVEFVHVKLPEASSFCGRH